MQRRHCIEFCYFSFSLPRSAWIGNYINYLISIASRQSLEANYFLTIGLITRTILESFMWKHVYYTYIFFEGTLSTKYSVFYFIMLLKGECPASLDSNQGGTGRSSSALLASCLYSSLEGNRTIMWTHFLKVIKKQGRVESNINESVLINWLVGKFF